VNSYSVTHVSLAVGIGGGNRAQRADRLRQTNNSFRSVNSTISIKTFITDSLRELVGQLLEQKVHTQREVAADDDDDNNTDDDDEDVDDEYDEWR